MILFAIACYAVAMIAANLTVAAFGPAVVPLNAFLLIGFDLAMRDWLHLRLKPWQMLLMIGATGALTYLLNPAAGMIAIASTAAFTVAALADWAAFSALKAWPWMLRSNASNVVGATVDSLIFPTIAFGALMPHIVLTMIVAKIVGGAAWAWLLSRRLDVARA